MLSLNFNTVKCKSSDILKTLLMFSDEAKKLNRVATDLENLEKSGNLKETSESQGICDKIPKSGKSQGILLSEIYFQPS